MAVSMHKKALYHTALATLALGFSAVSMPQAALAGNPAIIVSTGDLDNPCIPKFIQQPDSNAKITLAPGQNLFNNGCTNPAPSQGFGSGVAAPSSSMAHGTNSYGYDGFSSYYGFSNSVVVTPDTTNSSAGVPAVNQYLDPNADATAAYMDYITSKYEAAWGR